MKRRGFLQTLAGLCAGQVVPVRALQFSGLGSIKSVSVAMPPRFSRAGFAAALRPGLEKMFEAEYRHLEYGYNAVMRGDSLKFEKVQR